MTDWIERNRGYILVIIINLAVVGAALVWMRYPGDPQLQMVSAPSPVPGTPVPTRPALLRVDVAGAVAKPDVYELPAGSIVKDAIHAAGGVTKDADLAQINLAVELRDQQQVYVPRIGEAGANTPPGRTELGSPPSSPPAATVMVNINTASAEELDSLPGIGPELARRIVEWRTTHGDFGRIEDIKQVRGIGDSIFGQIEHYITVGP